MTPRHRPDAGGRGARQGTGRQRQEPAKKQAETLKRHEQQRAEETRLAMTMNSATLQLCVVTVNALTGGHNNDNVERAQLAAQEAEEAHNKRAHGMNSIPFGQCRICPEMYILLYSPHIH